MTGEDWDARTTVNPAGADDPSSGSTAPCGRGWQHRQYRLEAGPAVRAQGAALGPALPLVWGARAPSVGEWAGFGSWLTRGSPGDSPGSGIIALVLANG